MDDNTILTITKKAAQYDALVEFMFTRAKLSPKISDNDRDELYFDCFDLQVLLQAFEPRRYKLTLDILMAQAEMKIRIDEERMAKEAADGAAD